METWPATMRALHEDELGDAGEMLARAFADDPLCLHLFPDEATRHRHLSAALTWNVRYGLRYGEVLATPGGLDGVVALLEPSEEHFTPERLTASGYERIAESMREQDWWSFDVEFARVFGVADARLHEATGADHWYLDVIGVEPSRQGMGIGSALLAEVNRRADAAGAPVALLTYQPATLEFYRRHGYEVACEGVDAVSGIRYWGCGRPSSSDGVWLG
jgi:GNAT superfamily N-acetyltransferase